jgi:malonyl CoA-acyl carrier protein transacylase
VFLFSGQGSVRQNMGHYLLKNGPVFKALSQKCFKFLKENFNITLNFSCRYPIHTLEYDTYTPLLIFIFQYALAEQFMAWGIHPDYMIGHSLGEYIAAAVSGIWKLEDALSIIKSRSELMANMEEGRMISVTVSYDQASQFVTDTISVAAINSPSQCVLSGNVQAMKKLEKQLMALGIQYKYLKNTHAYHSRAIDPIIENFYQILIKYEFHAPKIPIISSKTGHLAQAESMAIPEYWIEQMRSTVQFSSCITSVQNNSVLLEVGPTQTLSALALQHNLTQTSIINVFSGKIAAGDEYSACLNALGQLWQNGISINWESLYPKHAACGRISMPLYPFNRQKCWVSDNIKDVEKNTTLTYSVDWIQSDHCNESIKKTRLPSNDGIILVFSDKNGVSKHIMGQWGSYDEKHIIKIYKGDNFIKKNENIYIINPTLQTHYQKVFDFCQKIKKNISSILYCWIFDDNPLAGENWHYRNNYLSHLDTINVICKILSKLDQRKTVQLIILGKNIFQVLATDKISPDNSFLLGQIMTIPHEHERVDTKLIDIGIESVKTVGVSEDIHELLFNEIDNSLPESGRLIAYRGGQRYLQRYKSLPFPEKYHPIHRNKQIYVISGGLGDIGLIFAEYLSKAPNSVVLLLHHSPFPRKKEWNRLLSNKGTPTSIKRKISKIQQLEKHITVELIQVNVSIYKEVSTALNTVLKKYKYINILIHTAGVADGKLIQDLDQPYIKKIIYPKALGAWHLHRALRGTSVDLMVFCSALSSITGEIGQMAYNAANAFLDHFAIWRSRYYGRTLSINWDRVKNVGMSKDVRFKQLLKKFNTNIPSAINEDDLIKIFSNAILTTQTNIIVSKELLLHRMKHTLALKDIVKTESHVDTLKLTPKALNIPTILETLRKMLSEYIGRSDVSVKTNLLSIGVDSLTAIQIAKTVANQYNLTPDPHIFINISNTRTIELSYIIKKNITYGETSEAYAILNYKNQRRGGYAKPIFLTPCWRNRISLSGFSR